MTDVVIVSARDGCAVALDLAHSDPLFRADQIILADRVDGHSLPDTEGPCRLIIQADLRGARQVRMVTAIEVRRLGVIVTAGR